MSLVYCYGLIEKSLNLELKGLETKNVYLIAFKELNAVVSDVSDKEFSQDSIDKNVKDMKWLTKHGQIHEKVIDSIMEKTTIIPLKFCTIFKDKKGVEEMLEEKYADFKFNLTDLKGKIEMTVKVYFDSIPLRKKITDEDNEIKELKKKLEGKKPGARYFDEQKIEILLNERIRVKLGNSTKEIFEKISSSGERAKKNELIDKKLTGKDMLLNGVFLINKEDIENFKKSIEILKSTYRDFEIQVWGPFPPYNFIK
jgi:hypothetical protein